MRLVFGGLLAASLAAGCGSDDARPAGTGASYVPSPPPAAPGTACVDAPERHELCITSVRGEVVDGDGRGITLPINLCNAEKCFTATSYDGVFNVAVSQSLDLSRFLIHAYGYPDYGDTFVRLARPETPVVMLDAPVIVPRLEHSGPTVPESAPSPVPLVAGPLTLTLVAGTSVLFYPAHDQRALRAGAVPKPERFDPSLVALYATGPFGARLSMPAEIEVPLAAPLADGTRLDVLMLDDDLASPTVGQLVWAGTAFANGGVARGAGITRLTWVGLRTTATP